MVITGLSCIYNWIYNRHHNEAHLLLFLIGLKELNEQTTRVQLLVWFADSPVSPQGWNQEGCFVRGTEPSGAHRSIIILLANHCVTFK